ncbi:MAG: tryptophan synthase subunit beta [Spirochaetes bacterium]|nr:MAG: tryptophan synthase subunit beta [Spirochaetota bacterium]
MTASALPDARGYFGKFGGRFVPETLANTLAALEEAYAAFRADAEAQATLGDMLANYAGRPTPLYHAKHISSATGVRIYLKREDLLHTGAHKLNNTLGQAMLARYMGKRRLVAETGAGQHGVATATVAALMNMECVVYMGETDIARQMPNVKRMKLLGARVVPVTSGGKTLKDSVNEAMRDWVKHCRGTHYLLGSVAGPHPFPMIVRDFQSVIGHEARAQMRTQTGGDPDAAIACVGGGSNAAGLFHEFIGSGVELVGVEAGGRSYVPGDHSASLTYGVEGILHGCLTTILQNRHGQVDPVHSISAGLDYPSVGPEHSFWKEKKLVRYETCSDRDALVACLALARAEGIIPALESSHALGYVLTNRRQFKGRSVIVNLSGRGDKDLDTIMKEAGI